MPRPPEFLTAHRYLADPSTGNGLEARFTDPTLAPWLDRIHATLVRPVLMHPYWSVWRGSFFLGASRSPHAAIHRARRYYRSWARSRSHPYRSTAQHTSIAPPRTDKEQVNNG